VCALIGAQAGLTTHKSVQYISLYIIKRWAN